MSQTFAPRPAWFFLLTFVMVVVYLILVEVAKQCFCRLAHERRQPSVIDATQRL
jgi:hypothetical protein